MLESGQQRCPNLLWALMDVFVTGILFKTDIVLDTLVQIVKEYSLQNIGISNVLNFCKSLNA